MNREQENTCSPEEGSMARWKLWSIVLVAAIVAGVLGGIGGYKASLSRLKNVERSLRDYCDKKTSELDAKLLSHINIKPEKVALVDITSPGGYSLMSTDGGIFYLSLQDAQPYLDGYKLLLQVGNPMNAVYNGFILKAEWGDWLDKGNRKEKTQSYTQNLKPGSWNQVEFILSPVKTLDEIKFLRFSIDVDRVTLAG